MKKKASPMAVRIEMIVTNREVLEHGWTEEQARKLHDALEDFIATTTSLWAHGHTRWTTQRVSEEQAGREMERMDGIEALEPRGLSA